MIFEKKLENLNPNLEWKSTTCVFKESAMLMKERIRKSVNHKQRDPPMSQISEADAVRFFEEEWRVFLLSENSLTLSRSSNQDGLSLGEKCALTKLCNFYYENQLIVFLVVVIIPCYDLVFFFLFPELPK